MTASKRNTHLYIRFALLGILILQLVTACSLGNSTGGTFTNVCNVPQDQNGTISGHWSTSPIPIALHQNDFNNNEISAITAAADSWNAFFMASKNITALTYSSGGTTNVSTVADPSNGNTL